MRRDGLLPGTPVGIPRARPIGAEVTLVRAFHQPGESTSAVAVIVVVALPHVAEAVARDFVAVAKIMTERREMFAVRIDAQREAARPDSSIIAFAIAGVSGRAV